MGDDVFKFFDKSTNGTLTSDELKKSVTYKMMKRRPDLQVTEAEIEQFCTAIDVDGKGVLKAERIVSFIDQGADGIGGNRQRHRQMPANWLPRVALLSHDPRGSKGMIR